LRERLIEAGLQPSRIVHPQHMPDGEFGITDPDGYDLRIGQLRRQR